MGSVIDMRARQVVAARGTRELPAAIAALAKAIEDADAVPARFREMARAEWEKDGEIEIDDDAVISESEDGGAYVQAWVWVYDDADQ